MIVMAITACSADGRTSIGDTPAPDPVPLHVSVQIGRVAATRGLIQLELAPTDATAAVTITSLQLRDPRFAEVPPTPRATTIDRLLHIPVDPGSVICSEVATMPPRAAITLGDADDPISLPIDAAGAAVLTAFHDTACDRQAVIDAATIAFAPEWTPTGPATARGTISVKRRASDQPITLEQLEGTVIFALEVQPTGTSTAPRDAVAHLAADDHEIDVPVEVSAARCDAHALAESKKTFLFPAWVSVADREPVFLTIEPEGPARAFFDELMTVGCHDAP